MGCSRSSRRSGSSWSKPAACHQSDAPAPGHRPSRPQPAPAVAAPATDPAPAGHRAAGEPHRGNDADGLVRRAGCAPRRYPVTAPARRAIPRRRRSCTRRQSYRLRDARSRSPAAAWPQAGQPAPEEEIVVTTGTPHAGPAARQARAATPTQAPRKLGLVLAVIATAQLMVALGLTIVNVALPHIRQALGFSGPNLEWVVNAYAVAFGG